MRVTFLGHAGLFVETKHGSVLCDPWFTPAYFGSWFPYPRNDDLDLESILSPDYLYVSHLHRDHFDPAILSRVDRRARVLLPAFRFPGLERALRDLGFGHVVRAPDGEALDLDGLEVAIVAMNQPADGPLGDSLLVLGDGTARILDQNDARPGDVPLLQRLGPYDAHFLQYSGAIWYPVVYDFSPEEKARLAREKRVNQMARARQYVEWVGAPNVFPSAGPPCFLDDDLFALNDVDDDPTNIFPDQRVFLAELADHRLPGELVVPGTVVELDGPTRTVAHPSDRAATEPFADKRGYLSRYRADWEPWLAEERASWARPGLDLLGVLREWIEPILERAPITSAGVGGNVVLAFGPDEGIVVDFVEREVRPWRGETSVYRVDVDRALVEACADERLEDWVNSLFLSCRFRAHREGPFNEYVMTFFKALSVERIDHVEECFRAARRPDEHFERDGWRIERWCPHRQADLTRFGEISDGVLTCALHHWQFDLATGRCLTSDEHRIDAERIDDDR